MKRRQQKKKAVRAQPEATNKTRQIALCIFLIVATLTVYWQVLDHEFINYDDNEYITKNWNVQAGLTPESIAWAFTTGHFSNWHPITWLSHILDYQLYGLQPQGHLLTNLSLHIANALLLFLVLMRMTGAFWQCSFVATMFALHPFNAESVAWVAERKNVLSTFFWLLTMWFYLNYVEKPGVRKLGWVALFLALGLMSKPMLVTLPFVLLLMDYWPLKRLRFERGNFNSENPEENPDKNFNLLQLVREKISLFLLVAASSTATFIVQKSGGALQAMEVNTLPTRLTNAMVSYLVYLEKAAWPIELAVFYPHPGNTLASWKGAIAGAILVCITIFAVKKIQRAPYFAVGWFWYLGTLAPVIQIVQTGQHAMADRYAYIPLIGIFIILAWGLPELLADWRYRSKALSVSAGLLIPVLMLMTWVQVSHWKDSITVFRHAIGVAGHKYPDIALTHNNLGIALEERGNISEAIAQYQIAIKVKSDFAPPHNNLGNLLFATKKTDEAIIYFNSALKLRPDYAMAHNNLGIALEEKGEIKEALAHYREAVRIDPGLILAHYNLGIILKEKGALEEAVFHYREAIKLKPDFALAYVNLGNVLLTMRETEEAITQYRLAIKTNPNLALAQNNLKIALRQSEERGKPPSP
ncbi:MAG: tetratricopeptide repeat protein [Nitrospina sp.]|jgi:protein O-mannosyl-transferase|nr:tetratricopeptide repeat protein [Nitrospina sp.]